MQSLPEFPQRFVNTDNSGGIAISFNEICRMRGNCMKILVIGESAWDNRNATGNTYSNWFDGDEWAEDQFSQVYFRMQKPRNPVCKDYYRMTDIEILKKLLHPQDIGEHFSYDASAEENIVSREASKEQKITAALHRRPHHFIYFGKEMLRRTGIWMNKRFEQYITEYDPDIIFSGAGATTMPKVLFDFLRTHTRAKIVLFSADDLYGLYSRYPAYRRKALMNDFKWVMQHADSIYGASALLCSEYGKKFGVTITPLYKGCDFEAHIKKNNSVLRFVYAGNLLYGRAETLAVLSKVISEVNEQSQKVFLEIYTGTAVTSELEKKLNIEGASQIMGIRSYSEIKTIMRESDVVLHVESFEQSQIDYVHYSFSTKIIDCLQSGSVALGIGPANIASIEYMRQIPGTRVVDNIGQLKECVLRIVDERAGLFVDSEKIREYAICHHDIHNVRKGLRADLLELCSE